MPRFHWTDDYKIGISAIDSQHARIVEYLNALDKVLAGKDKASIEHVLEELIDYTRTHFVFEEDMLEQADFPSLAEHRQGHAHFIKNITEFQKRAAAGEDIAQELLTMLQRWLVAHILNDDVEYAALVKKSFRLNPSHHWNMAPRERLLN
jgi:hemerythrin